MAMACSVLDGLQERLAQAALAWGKFDESLQGIARTNEHMLRMEQLEQESRDADSALSEHKTQRGCQMNG